MSTETSLVTADSSSQQTIPAITPPEGSTGTIAFRKHLFDEIHAYPNQSGNTKSAVTHTNHVVAPGASEESSTSHSPSAALPLYDRLYGYRGQLTPLQTDSPMGTAERTPVTAANTTAMRRIKNFADAIRKPASVAAMELGTSTNTVIAFAGLETGWGKHIPGTTDTNSNNLFGIKSHNTDHPSISNSTTEFVDGKAQTVDQQFRSYQSIEESIADFSYFLRSNPRYREALTYSSNPMQFINKVHEAGYATDPQYANKVISALKQLDSMTTNTGAIGIGW